MKFFLSLDFVTLISRHKRPLTRTRKDSFVPLKLSDHLFFPAKYEKATLPVFEIAR